jgi:hypothetical protein
MGIFGHSNDERRARERRFPERLGRRLAMASASSFDA